SHPVRVLRPGRSEPARQQHRAGPAASQHRSRPLDDPADDARLTNQPLAERGGGGPGPLRGSRARHSDPPVRADQRGSRLPADDHHLSAPLDRCALLSGGRPGDHRARCRAAGRRRRVMSNPRPGLGRGLSALIPTSPAQAKESGLTEVEGARLREIPVEQISPNPRQPRQVFDEEEMAELVHSIKEIGLLQPIVVRPTGPESYELIMGERRWRAHQKAGLRTISAVVRETTDEDLLRDALLENLHRSQLNPLEEAAAYQQLLEDFGCTQEELSEKIGRSRPQITNTIRLLKLPPAVQRRVAAGVLSAG